LEEADKLLLLRIKSRKKVNYWSNKNLSQLGREILIKRILQAISSYIMSIFLIPSSLSDENGKNDELVLVGGS